MKLPQTDIAKTSYAITACGCLLLVSLLLWRLAADGFHFGGRVGILDLANCAPALDSFSEPSVALAVLKQEAELLMLSYDERKAQAEAARAASLWNGVAASDRTAFGLGSNWSGVLNSPAARQAAALKLLAKLHAEVEDLEMDLNRKLLTAYSQNASCNEFLDCYVRLVQQLPAPSAVALWTPYALECARKCGRGEEVTDALHHAIRFQQNPDNAKGTGTVQEMKALPESWEAENPQASEVSRR
jgi:hypothetical protein